MVWAGQAGGESGEGLKMHKIFDILEMREVAKLFELPPPSATFPFHRSANSTNATWTDVAPYPLPPRGGGGLKILIVLSYSSWPSWLDSCAPV